MVPQIMVIPNRASSQRQLNRKSDHAANVVKGREIIFH